MCKEGATNSLSVSTKKMWLPFRKQYTIYGGKLLSLEFVVLQSMCAVRTTKLTKLIIYIMEKNNKTEVIKRLDIIGTALTEIRDLVIESDTAVERVKATLKEFGNNWGVFKDEPTAAELNDAVMDSIDSATEKAAAVASEEAANVIEKKVEEVKSTQTDESAKIAVAKVKDETVKEVKEAIESKKEEIKKQAKDSM